MRRLLVCGSRKFTNYEKVKRVVEQLLPDYMIFGDCIGVDTLAHDAAHEIGISHDPPYVADWNGYGNSAGAIRNKEMLRKGKPDVVAAIFDDRINKGTTLMANLARDAGVPVIEFFLKSEATKPYTQPRGI